ncbi:MAG: DUF2007 domain-containing protein [Chitinophagaceae bacterium]|jgi:benzoyl-CoA reductase/2-hydroxyglutaryl-CoA dehydratase subunit BcrC/BadD/HgdB|nr:MAG: DUF2007 domain-containing protein [Chitinophagaceae bacterium]
MEKDWIIVFTTGSSFEAELVKGMLKENDIDGVIINQRDSSYGVFGEVYVYVYKDFAEKALQLIRETENQ